MGQRLIFLLGGARSGKSTAAETWAREHGGRVLFVATAQAFDDEMRERIALHRAARPPDWTTLEVPLHVGQAVSEHAGAYDVVLIDCLTLLASNALLALPEDCTQTDADSAILAETDALLAAYRQSSAAWLIVSNEVGMGIVPPYRLGRLYRDSLGRANQRIAQHADQVMLLVAGLTWTLKG
ncbi:MAG: bifunctional adenosylcobinamide kinase/adenosylcobinamide-phosphate guanylyltransferase [bacterium]|nr:bifunctional adenosylcobinamide kinase/adenosylcobinamide-phosphate guanylyltransferase [bacterium]